MDKLERLKENLRRKGRIIATLWCGYDGLCDECKQKQEKEE